MRRLGALAAALLAVAALSGCGIARSSGFDISGALGHARAACGERGVRQLSPVAGSGGVARSAVAVCMDGRVVQVAPGSAVR